MADVNTDTGESEGFIFGQNMAERVVKPVEEDDQNGDAKPSNINNGKPTEDGEDGAASSEDSQTSAPVRLLRPSAFNSQPATGGGILAPSRLSTNPFSQSSHNASNNNEGANVLSPARLANNPFAVKPSSDSEDEKGSKPIVAPASFNASKTFGSPRRGLFDNSANSTGSTSRFLLRPSALDKQTENFKSNSENTDGTSKPTLPAFKLEPAKLQNPFLKTANDEKEEGSVEKAEPTGGGTSEETEKKEDRKCESGASSEAVRDHSQDNSGPSFIFGQNLHERVMSSGKGGAKDKVESPVQETEAAANSNSSFVFGENLADKVAKPPESTEPAVTGEHPTLEESAAAHQAKLSKPEFQKVDVVTGEENESNVLQVNAKLFAFEKDTQNWLEKGRGLLRLNDMSTSDGPAFQSRLVMRTQGSLRVVLNSKLWSGMMVERASPKTVRFTATEDDCIRIFLIMASSKDADQMYSAIDRRIQQLKMQECHKDDGGTSTQEPTSESQMASQGSEYAVPLHTGQKRHKEETTDDHPPVVKKRRFDPERRRDIVQEESNDSSTIDPETEVSNESFSSTNKSSSSD